MNEKKQLYFDCTTGVSGDMIFASLLDLGVTVEAVKQELKKLKLGVSEIAVMQEEKYGVKGTNVFVQGKKHEHKHEPGHEHGHNHENRDENHSHRSFREIEGIILDAGLSQSIQGRAVSIYKTIAEAEAAVHETDIDHVHFHEVGRDSAIVNIVGTAICLELLGVDAVTCSELHDGTGFIECSHGVIPVPVPAVLELLKNSGLSLVQEDVNTEMVTPSGIGILKGLRAIYQTEIPDAPVKTGYGFGKKNMGKLSVVTAYLLDKSCK